jgi:hypothetical protein
VVRIHVAERARFSWQRVVGQEVAGPKRCPKGCGEEGNPLIFGCLDLTEPYGTLDLALRDRVYGAVAPFNRTRFGECCNDEN